MARCPWKVHWGVSQESTTQCGKDEHVGATWPDGMPKTPLPQMADPEHVGRHANPAAPGGVTMISWLAGDRREYTGDWPGPCPRQPCTLHAGHHGSDAP